MVWYINLLDWWTTNSVSSPERDNRIWFSEDSLCHANANWTNTIGSYVCKCKDRYNENGYPYQNEPQFCIQFVYKEYTPDIHQCLDVYLMYTSNVLCAKCWCLKTYWCKIGVYIKYTSICDVYKMYTTGLIKNAITICLFTSLKNVYKMYTKGLFQTSSSFFLMLNLRICIQNVY